MSLLPRREDMFWADATAPDGFMLDGMRYDGQAVANGAKVAEGDKVFVARTAHGLTPGRRRGMVILQSSHGATRRGMSRDFFGVMVDVKAWLQSNASGGQNPLGSRVNPDVFPPNLSSYDFRLPTHTDPETDDPSLRALGLGRVEAPNRNWDTGDRIEGDPVDVLITAWPQRNGSDEVSLCLGAWRVSDSVNLWIANDGATYDPWENPAYPLQAKFFVDSKNGWGHALPLPTSNSPGTIFSACSRDIKFESLISRAAGDGLNLANVSLFSYYPAPTEEVPSPELESYLCCPACPATSGSGQASVDFLKMDQATGEWASHASYDYSSVSDGGPSLFPDSLPLGSETGSPVAIASNAALIPFSGGQLDLFDSNKWLKGHAALRAVKPDGAPGSFLWSKTFTATSSPTVLDPGSLKAAVADKTHSFYYASEGTWIGGVDYSSDTSSDYAHFGRAVPLFLPVDAPNTGRLGTIESRMAASKTGVPQWPLTLRNFSGGSVVDEAGTVWTCVLEPVPVLYGGEYSLEDNGTHEAYRLNTFTQVTGQSAVSGESFVASSPVDIVLGSIPVSVAVGSPVGPEYVYGTLPDDPPGTEPYVIFTYSASLTQIDDWDWKINRWNQYHGCKWQTWLRGKKTNGKVIEKNISQLLDATTTKLLGPPATEEVTVTQSNFEVGNNVHQIIPISDKGLVAVLRDLHADGADGCPTPHLEIWEVSGLTLVKKSTVRLGTYDELLPDDKLEWKQGDQAWDPYYFGPPRAKACRDLDGSPLVLVLVSENLKVDLDSESGFKRATYHTIRFPNPASPDVSTTSRTSPDEGVGNSGDVPGELPLWLHFDTLIPTPDLLAWIRDGKFRVAFV